MTDVFNKTVRSYVMSSIRKTESKPERTVRKHLHSKGFRYRKNVRGLPGCPDLVLRKYKTVVFVNGCFWHAHQNCKYNKMPKSNRKYWIPKINRNVERDRVNQRLLKRTGWKVIVLWECKIIGSNKQKYLDDLLARLREKELLN